MPNGTDSVRLVKARRPAAIPLVALLSVCVLAAVTLSSAQQLAGSATLPASPGPEAVAAAAAEVTVSPKLQKDYAKLQQKVERQTGADQSESLAKLAELHLQLAEDGYVAHQPDFALPHLKAALRLSDRAMVYLRAESKRGKKNGMQHVEETFQNMGFHLRGLASQISFRQRSQVEVLSRHIANLRSQLLQMLFASK